ncbi:hypothetical protein [Cytobacillus kochii]|uniref:hypothetical protein n=1 Tax=Cytobacillus kochii TaxID=859143 RepID=UPI0020409491|nr:hypothetical protein [Cytobacillus kochii]MCM3324252.1 hypothetical protein [Cytobacillus kochii]MCM3346679.1 hypothetical protein [Cytobacillus kochii]
MNEKELLTEFEKLQNHNLELQDIIINGMSNNISWIVGIFGSIFAIMALYSGYLIFKIGKLTDNVAEQQAQVNKQLDEVNQARNGAHDLLKEVKVENEETQRNIAKLDEIMNNKYLQEKLAFVDHLMDKEQKKEQKSFYLNEVLFYRGHANEILTLYLNNKKVEDMNEKELKILNLSNQVTSMSTDLMSRINNDILSSSEIKEYLEEIKDKYHEVLNIVKLN